MYWHHHYQNTANTGPGLDNLVSRLFQRQDLFTTWVKLYDVDRPWHTSINFRRALDDIPAPVYYASLLGLDQALHDLINSKQLESTTIRALSPAPTSSVPQKINARGGRYSNALQAALYRGYEKVVTMLLDKGADINAQGGEYGNALQAASSGGYKKVVTMLLDKGADINAQGKRYSNALQAASSRGYKKVVTMLLNHDAVVNWKDIQGRTPFYLASAGGRMKVVEILSSFRADLTVIDTQGRDCLYYAASKGLIEIVNWLLKEGFDPNYTNRDSWTSLYWAAKNGSVNTIKVLKAAGTRSTTEAIEGWTLDSVFNFYYNSPVSISRENAKSELVVK